MRIIRLFSVLIFIGSVVLFGKYKEEAMRNEDTMSPLISMDSETITVSSRAGRNALLKGVTAQDLRDGDVSDTLIVESMSNFIEKGRRTITIAAFDSSNNISKVTREVIYRDYDSPDYSLEEPFSFPVDTQNFLRYLEASDKLDGDLTGRIKMSTEYYVQVDEPGIYPMVFTVANSAGDVSKLPVNIEIYDPAVKDSQPKITLSEYLIYIEKGENIQPWDYVEGIYANGHEYLRGTEDDALHDEELENQFEKELEKLTKKERTKKLRTKEDYKFTITSEEFQIENHVNANQPGVYEIIYKYDAYVAEDEEDIKEKEKMTAEERERFIGNVRLIVVVNE